MFAVTQDTKIKGKWVVLYVGTKKRARRLQAKMHAIGMRHTKVVEWRDIVFYIRPVSGGFMAEPLTRLGLKEDYKPSTPYNEYYGELDNIHSKQRGKSDESKATSDKLGGDTAERKVQASPDNVCQWLPKQPKDKTAWRVQPPEDG